MTDPASEPLAKIGYCSYWRQLASLRPSPTGMLVCNAAGRVLWSNRELPRGTRDATALLLERLLASTSSSEQPETVSQISDNGYNVHAVRLHGRSGDLVGLIGVVLPACRNAPAARAEELEPVLCGMAESVAREEELIAELDAMATELAFRYEELNLLYNIADDSEIEQTECEQTLNELVEICGPHLESTFATIILPQQNIVSYYALETGLPENSGELVQLLKREMCPWVIANHRPLVLNAKNDPLRAEVYPSPEGKVMACPVLNELESAYGIIAVMRPETAPDFTTGDRRLLEVVAKKAEKVIQLSYDALTGLMNRKEFIRNLDKSLATAHSRGIQCCLLVMDIDHLKSVNDAFGHEAGDAVLRNVTAILRTHIDERRNIISRIGGDHFAILMPRCTPAEGQRVGRGLAKAIGSTLFSWRESRRNITVSIGIAVMDRHTPHATTALSGAEIACDVARGLNADRVSVYNESAPVFLEKREDMHWVGMIQDALVHDGFVLYCQPIEAVRTPGSGPAYQEILLRLQDDTGNITTPGRFMPAAERFYLMPEIDRWVVRNLFEYLGNPDNRIDLDRYVWFINLSGQSLSDVRFLRFVTEQLSAHGIPPKSICFEVTETAAVTNIDRAQRLIDSLRTIGCRFSLDDFGTGLSSFGYLKSLSVDHLKIDGSFVRDVLQNKTSEAVVSSIIHLGHVLELGVIAEWVENDAVKHKLDELGVDFVQGYGIGRPLAIQEWLRS